MALALNARDGPGIVLDGLAFDSGIVDWTLYTVFIILAVLASLMTAARPRFARDRDSLKLRDEEVLQRVAGSL